MLGVAPSVLLAKLADSDNTSSSDDDDDEGRVYEAKFAELFDAPCTVPKVKAYVSIVRTYSDKARMIWLDTHRDVRKFGDTGGGRRVRRRKFLHPPLPPTEDPDHKTALALLFIGL
ncbi:hypothetical protein HPB47_009411 [Ixodes persulcatus]|uniref:Uncharacterized protein n=1 Tax=Ixodes persulcatus TaxID=34615 RepID=A0AC60P260_IXOPE|nr:hypothetical protein HPB47_009411 [Ixodes persulcatus]